MDALNKQDRTVKFYKRGANEGTLTAKDAAMLAQLRDDKNTSDAVYRTACASFGRSRNRANKRRAGREHRESAARCASPACFCRGLDGV